MSDKDANTLVQAARSLMIDALAMLDSAGAWEASAHLDLALTRLESSIARTQDGDPG